MRHGGGMSTAKADLESDSTVVCSFLDKRFKEAFERGSMCSSIKCLSRLAIFIFVGSILCVKIRVIQTPLFVSGINTFLQVLFATKLPAVIGGSSADIVPIFFIIGDSSLQRITELDERFLHSKMETQGVLIVAASLKIILGFSQVWGLFSL
ncbi:hypothetical protein C5167_025582 [Papaver somniferum]|uniref:Uncharacterized protein n=1 Tax=Papaver somniferum TaxID=3469 RepID=A0A4Y7JUX2_PAPSO|nr:hypothetical protein C5167_025582 [Papaver somniferum]